MLTPLWNRRKERLANAHPNRLLSPDKYIWQIATVGIIGLYRLAGGMIMLHSVFFQERRGSLGEPKANRSFLFYSSIIKPVITPILDLLFLEKSNTSIRINISLKILFHYRLGYWTCFF